MFNKIKAYALAAGLVIFGFVVGGEAAFAYQSHMFNALSDLRAASQQLNVAIRDKAGHRDNAIGLVSQAIGQVHAGIAAGRR